MTGTKGTYVEDPMVMVYCSVSVLGGNQIEEVETPF